MSVVAQAVATVVATPVPSPAVVVQTVAVTPEQVKALLQLILLVGSGMVASIVHALFDRNRIPFGLNFAILGVYSFLIAGLDLFLQGTLKFDNLPALGVAFFTVLGAAVVRYNTSKALIKASAPKEVALV